MIKALDSQMRFVASENVSVPTLSCVHIPIRRHCQMSLISEVELYRGRCEDLSAQLASLTAALEISNVNYNNLELRLEDEIERLKSEHQGRDCMCAFITWLLV